MWEERRRVLPDTDHPGLLAIVERRITEEEDLILLLGASAAQFRAADAIVEEAAQAASRAGLGEFDREAALDRLTRPRREVNAEIEARLENFARCGRDRIDEWADQFRLERRLPLARALALLAVPAADWRQPPRQSYVATLLDFYARRITASIMRGPLTRMVIGKTTARIDMMELDSARRRASSLLDHVLLRNDQTIDIDPASLTVDPRVERRVRTLHSHATLYRRDTGIDGLYLGFPFLVMQEAKASLRPRIAPVLLWPVRLHPEVGSRGRVTLAFDRGREEVRLNPAFETLLGVEAAGRWQQAANEMLGRSTVTPAEVLDAFRELATVEGRELVPLPSKDLNARVGEDRLFCSAALFHLAFLGQAVMEDLRQLKSAPPTGSSLETAFRVGEEVERAEPVHAPEIERYFTADSDPSQEAAVLEARTGRGLLVEGPPGTGKSQTIVNMVADAIGTGRSLLVVCQKQAALEVVHKRLEAAGLGERIVMVNDVNKDRRTVIQSIREQLEELFRRPGGATGWRQQRQQAAARIESLERDLDGQHRALHAVDEQTGLSYRLVIGDLIGLAREGETPPVPSLRHQLGALDPGELALLQETCAPIARLWLPARFEGSPLADTRQFGVDPGTVQTFTADVAEFARLERERMSVIERTPDAIAIEDPNPTGHGPSATPARYATSTRRRARVSRAGWPCSRGRREREPGGTTLQRDFATIDRDLLGLPADDAPDDAVEVARAMDDGELESWTAVSDRLLSRPSFLQKLSPGRWIALWRRRSLMRRTRPRRPACARCRAAPGGRPPAGPRPAVGRGRRRGRTGGRAAAHAHPRTAGGGSTPPRAAGSAAEALVARLEAYPERPVAYAMARAASRQAVEDMIEGIDQGLARHAARTASLAALARLGPWMSEGWNEARGDAVRRDGSNTTAVDPGRGRSAAHRRLPALPRAGAAARRGGHGGVLRTRPHPRAAGGARRGVAGGDGPAHPCDRRQAGLEVAHRG